MSEIEVIKISENINQIDVEIRNRLKGNKYSLGLKAREEAAAKAEADYDKAVLIKMAELAAGKEYKVGTTAVKDLGASNRERLAKGICWAERCTMLQAVYALKGLKFQVEALEKLMNGQQSILSKLEQMAK